MKIAILEHLLHVPEDEVFATARQLGFEGVELSFGAYDAEHRTLWQPGGGAKRRALADAAGVALPSLSAAYFHRFALTPADQAEAERANGVLLRLIEACAEARVPLLHLPLFGASEPRTAADWRRCHDQLRSAVGRAADHQVTIGFDALLPAEDLRQFVAQLESPAAKVYYDVGNAWAAGRDVAAEIHLLAPVLVQVRVKDRDRREPFAGVPLGKGAVDWKEVMQALEAVAYAGWLVLDTPSGDDSLASARRNRDYLVSGEW